MYTLREQSPYFFIQMTRDLPIHCHYSWGRFRSVWPQESPVRPYLCSCLFRDSLSLLCLPPFSFFHLPMTGPQTSKLAKCLKRHLCSSKNYSHKEVFPPKDNLNPSLLYLPQVKKPFGKYQLTKLSQLLVLPNGVF